MTGKISVQQIAASTGAPRPRCNRDEVNAVAGAEIFAPADTTIYSKTVELVAKKLHKMECALRRGTHASSHIAELVHGGTHSLSPMLRRLPNRCTRVHRSLAPRWYRNWCEGTGMIPYLHPVGASASVLSVDSSWSRPEETSGRRPPVKRLREYH
jgi:hypothetical protein